MSNRARITPYHIAVIVSVIANVSTLAPQIAAIAFEIGKNTVPAVSLSDYGTLAIYFVPFLGGFVYYLLSSDKRLLFPLTVQFGTVAASTLIMIADTIVPANSGLVLSNLFRWWLLIGAFVLALSLTLVFVGVIQVLVLRVVLGMEIKEQPISTAFSVDIPVEKVMLLVNRRFQASHALKEKKSDIPGVFLYAMKWRQGEEIVLAIASREYGGSVVALSAAREEALYLKQSALDSDIMEGLSEDIRGKIRLSYPKAEFAEAQADNPALRASMSFSLRHTQVAFSRLRAVPRRLGRKISIPIREVPDLKFYGAIGAGLIAAIIAIAIIRPPGAAEFLSSASVGLLLDICIPIYQAYQEAKRERQK